MFVLYIVNVKSDSCLTGRQMERFSDRSKYLFMVFLKDFLA